MNNKFFEIGREATVWCCDNLPSDDPDWEHKWEQKYGELIVQECLNLVGNHLVPNYPYTAIANHFGVYHD